MTKLQELLLAASSVANGATSASHRAIGVRNIDRLGLEWVHGLPAETEWLATAIAASVRALAAATTCEARTHIANAIIGQVAAARARPVTPAATRKTPNSSPRRYWMDAER
jgi:hypothetical protein